MPQQQNNSLSTAAVSEKAKYYDAKDPKPDTCWCWFICMALALSNAIVCGIVISYGIIFPTLLEEFQQGKAKTALVGSVAMVGLGIFSTLVAKVYNRLGPRVTVIIGAVISSSALLATSQGTSIYLILLTYGVIFGFGSCFIFLPPYLVIPRYFVKRRSLAVGIVAMGVGGGLFLMSPIMKALLDALGWRKTFMVLSGFVALSVPLVCTIQRLPPEETENRDEQRHANEKWCNLSMWSVFRNKRFGIIFLSMNLYYIVHYIPSVHMVRYCEDLGISASQASQLYLYSGLTSMLSRPVVGWLCDMKCIDAIYIYQLVAGINGVATLILPFARNYLHFVLYFIVDGLADGTVGCSSCIAILSCFTSEKRSLGFGLAVMVSAPVAAAGPPLGGLLADEVGSYVPAFYMTGVVTLLAASIIFLVPIIKSAETKRTACATVSDHEVMLVVEKCTVV